MFVFTFVLDRYDTIRYDTIRYDTLHVRIYSVTGFAYNGSDFLHSLSVYLGGTVHAMKVTKG